MFISTLFMLIPDCIFKWMDNQHFFAFQCRRPWVIEIIRLQGIQRDANRLRQIMHYRSFFFPPTSQHIYQRHTLLHQLAKAIEHWFRRGEKARVDMHRSFGTRSIAPGRYFSFHKPNSIFRCRRKHIIYDSLQLYRSETGYHARLVGEKHPMYQPLCFGRLGQKHLVFLISEAFLPFKDNQYFSAHFHHP